MQSVNEELQSTNEELETSKEELQSVNEELSTVNSELYSKVSDLTRANNDMNNLLAGTGIGTVFVDHELRIMRFTPAASQFINLIQSDTGRPVGHIVSNLLAYDSLTLDVQTVLDSLVPIQLEVQTRDGKWCTMRIQPYRTLENVIEGVVISFVDISDIVKTRLLLQDVNALTRLAVVVRDASDAIIVQNLEGRILAWNQSAEKLYGWTEDEALKLNFADRLQSDEKPTSLQQLNEMRFAATHSVVASKRLRKDGTLIDVSVTSSALLNVTGEAYAIATTECLVVRQS
jgi:two-component system CheB/CheR fusion protein